MHQMDEKSEKNVANSANVVISSTSLPSLNAVIESLRRSFHLLIPEDLLDDSDAFENHLSNKKALLISCRNDWRYGIGYTFDTLRHHAEWYVKNRKYIQLKKDEEKVNSQMKNIKLMLNGFVSELENILQERTTSLSA